MNEDWFETPHLTAGDQNEKTLQNSGKHHCAKCGTGYAGPECEPPPQNSIDRESIIRDLLRFIVGENPDRPGLQETPSRVVKAWEHWTGGYKVDTKALLKSFEDGADKYDEMVVRKGIPIYSVCEHHLCPIVGTCTIAYIPVGHIVGLSKLDRLADAYARRLQVQERLTNQIADDLFHNVQPLGVGVYINARHFCIETRGVCHPQSDTITCALRGVMRSDPAARSEFLALVNNGS